MSKCKHLKKIVALSLGVCSLFSTSSCDKLSSLFPSENSMSSTASNNEVTLTVSEFNEPVSLVHDSVLSYLEATPDTLVSSFLSHGTERLDKGQPLTIQYRVQQSGDEKVKSVKAEFSFDENFSKIERTETYSTLQRKLYIYNLQTGARYYFRITVTFGDGSQVSQTGVFETAVSPRMINLEGSNNVRDIGGWHTESGKTVKQGLLYRGSEIDGGKNTEHADFRLTEYGIEQLRALGIKTDLDLRSESVKVSEHSILGEDVAHEFYDAAQYEAIFASGNELKAKKIFSALAKPEAYPVYLHCTHGVDRAGSTSLLLEALLGVAKEDLIRDYELSAFYYNYAHVNRNLNNGGTILGLLERLEKYSGETLADKTAAFLLSVGVTQAEIDSIRSIFLS